MFYNNFVSCCGAVISKPELQAFISVVEKNPSFGMIQRPIFDYYKRENEQKATLYFNFDAKRSFSYGDMTEPRKYRIKDLSKFVLTVEKLRGFDGDSVDIYKARNNRDFWNLIVYRVSITTDAIKINLKTGEKTPFSLIPTNSTDFKEALEWIRNYGYPKE